MKNFFNAVLANIVAILIVCLLFGIMFVFMLILGSISENSSVNVQKNSVLTLDLHTHIIDSPLEDQDDIFSFQNKEKKVLLYDALQAIEHAKSDNNIKGISIETDHINAGITQLDDLRAALEDFKKSGKFVYAYGNNVSQTSYYLGSVADQYFLHPAGGIDLKGMATEVPFFKSFADKYGIGIDVIRHGKYKAAVEPFMLDEISPENKEQLSVLLNDIWGNVSQKIMTSRKLNQQSFTTTVDSLYGIIPDLSLSNKLADKLIQKSEYDDLLQSKLKVQNKDEVHKISFTKYIKSFKNFKEQNPENQIAVLYASGSINNGEGYDGIYAENTMEEIQKLAKNDKIKAVVFRINSPGGSANASDEILHELQVLKKKKPVIVSFGDYAASGGYYIAMAADKIFSEPNTLTGSIGVFGVIPNYKELANRNGIRADQVQTNANSAMYSPLNGLSEGGLNILTKSVEQTYKRFVYFVTQNRKKSFAQIDEIGGGRVWSGTKGKQLGLVDELGTLNDAIKFAAKKAQMKEFNVASYPKKKTVFEQLFEDMDEEKLSTKLLKSKLGEEHFGVFELLTDPKVNEKVMMELPIRVKF